MSRIDRNNLPGTTEALLKRLWRHAFLLSGHGDLAVDLVRAACARAVPESRWADAEPRADVRLFAALHAIWVEEVRPAQPAAAGDAGLHGPVGHTPASPLFAAEVLRDVWALAEPCREAVLLTYGEGLSYGETAAVLGCSERDVAGRLATARSALASSDREREGESPDDMRFATLTAYIDHELDPSARRGLDQDLEAMPELRDRLAMLRSGERPFRMSFDALLDTAPGQRLAALRAGFGADGSFDASGSTRPDARPSVDGSGSPSIWLAGARPRWWGRWWPILAGAVLGVGAGLAIGDLGHVVAWERAAQPTDVSPAANWQAAVIGSIALLSPDDVAILRDSVPSDGPQLGLVQERLGFDLAKVTALDGLVLKRVHLLRFRGAPIGELVYVSAFGSLVVLCIAVEPGTDSATEAKRIQGSSVVTWSRDGLSFMLAGGRDEGVLRAYAETIRRKL